MLQQNKALVFQHDTIKVESAQNYSFAFNPKAAAQRKAIKDNSRSKEGRKMGQVTLRNITVILIILVMKLTMAMSMKILWECQMVGLEYKNRGW